MGLSQNRAGQPPVPVPWLPIYRFIGNMHTTRAPIHHQVEAKIHQKPTGNPSDSTSTRQIHQYFISQTPTVPIKINYFHPIFPVTSPFPHPLATPSRWIRPSNADASGDASVPSRASPKVVPSRAIRLHQIGHLWVEFRAFDELHLG